MIKMHTVKNYIYSRLFFRRASGIFFKMGYLMLTTITLLSLQQINKLLLLY